MAIVKATVKGQIVIPADIRKKFRIVRGTCLNVYEQGKKIIVEPLQNELGGNLLQYHEGAGY